MKKLSRKGFTLVELLATITILGILMIVAIPAVNRIIESARRDTFLNTAKTYVNAVKNEVAADNIKCTYTLDGETVTAPISTIAPGYYGVVKFDSAGTDGQQLLEEGGRSPWGSKNVRGVVIIRNLRDTEKFEYYIAMVDSDGRGVGQYLNKNQINSGDTGYTNVKVVRVYNETMLARAYVFTKDEYGRKALYTALPSLTISKENVFLSITSSTNSKLYPFTGSDGVSHVGSAYPFASCVIGT